MYIVIDTTAVYGDKLFASPRVRTIVRAARALGGGLWAPEIVLDELEGQVRRELTAASSNITEAAEKIAKLVPSYSFPAGRVLDVEKAVRDYRSDLEVRLEEIAVGILPYPMLTPKEMVDRYYAGLRPYKKDGTGFKDHLVWRSFVEFVKARQGDGDRLFLFVTDNVSDFADAKGNLHADFRSDPELKGIEPNRIRLVRQLHDVIKEYVIPNEYLVFEANAGLEKVAYRVISERASELIKRGIAVDTVDIRLPPGISNFGIESLRTNLMDGPLVIRRIVDETLVEGVVEFECTYHGVAQLSDWEWIEDTMDVRYSDIDQDGHFVAFNAVAEGTTVIRFTLDGALKVTSIEAITDGSG